MEILVCIDDTDNIESRGTGELAELLGRGLEAHGWGKSSAVTRHQMLVHPDIPYTSHNSSMCFEAAIDAGSFPAFAAFARDFLSRESAEGSDPGLCIVDRGELAAPGELIAFGRRAKLEVLTKDDAYGLARRLAVHLSEHGGTGQGVIGALAGAGLRLSGNDGRFKGKFRVESADGVVTATELKRQTGVALIRSLDGTELQPGEEVQLGDKVKAVLLAGKSTLLVAPNTMEPARAAWQTCTREQLRAY